MEHFAKTTQRKQNADNKHRLFEIMSQINESISKRRFNHAFEMGSKYYEQNKTILTNEEIFQLCWKCCITIENKINHRLTSKRKKYVPPITQTHIQHLFTLEMSLHSIVLPELVKLNQSHFNMLRNKNQTINPKQISAQYIVFERKSMDYFFGSLKLDKQIKKLVKQHLRICNSVLMYKINNRKKEESIQESFKIMEQIYQQFEEYHFPSEHMDFMLIKLSFIQIQGLTGNISCRYRLPLGFLAKLYQKIQQEKESAIEHYINKLASFSVLGLRHLDMGIQEIYILCSQMEYITKLLSQKYESAQAQSIKLKKLPFKRLITIEKEPFQDMQLSFKRQESLSSCNKLSQKKMESKQTIKRSFESFKSIAEAALNHINSFLSSRREIIQIALKYFTQSFLEKSRNKDDETIQDKVILNRQLKKKSYIKDQIQEYKTVSQKPASKNGKTLTSMLRVTRLQKKPSSLQQNNEVQKVKFHRTTKQQGKFIIKNMENVQRKNELKIGYYRDVNNILKLVQTEEKKMNVEQIVLGQKSELEDFQLERLRKIKSFKERQRAKSNIQANPPQLSKDQTQQNQTDKGKQQKKIYLLNDVVQQNIKMLLQIPIDQKQGKVSKNSNSLTDKFQRLRAQSQNLNVQRKMLVQQLNTRRNQSLQYFKNQNIDKISTDKQIRSRQENQQEIAQYSLNFQEKIGKYIQNNKNLMKLDEKNAFKIKIQDKNSTKLKLDKKINKKMPEISFQHLQQQYKKLRGQLQDQKTDWQMALSSQFDKLRRDAAKNQFKSQNEQKAKTDKTKTRNNTIFQITLDDQQVNFY